MGLSMIKVVIADDHAILRRGLRQIIDETLDLAVVGEAENSAQAFKFVRENPCDVLLLDISMPDRNGIDTLKMIKKELPKISVLILSMHPENQYAVRALRAGAAGYLNKQSAAGQLVAAVREAAKGRKYVTPLVAEELANHLSHDNGEQPDHRLLSNREFQTMHLMASGKTLTEIAEALSLSIKTVSVYRARILEKLQLKSTAEITRYAIKNQLVE